MACWSAVHLRRSTATCSRQPPTQNSLPSLFARSGAVISEQLRGSLDVAPRCALAYGRLDVLYNFLPPPCAKNSDHWPATFGRPAGYQLTDESSDAKCRL